MEREAEKKDNLRLAADCAIQIAAAQRELRQYDRAITAAERAKRRYLAIAEPCGVANALREKALIISYDKRHRESLPVFREAVATCAKADGCELEWATAVWDMGVAKSMLG